MRELKVPNGWSKEYLGNLSIDGIKNGVFNDPKKVGKGTKLINVVNLYSGSEINTEKLTRLNLTEQEIAKYKVEVGDLFFTRSSLVLDGIARCNIILDGSEDIVYDGHIMRVRPNIEKVIPFYLKEYCLGDNAKGFFMRHAKTTTMTTIGQQEISKLPVLIPPLKEQEKIVSILSTWDKAIELKEKLIGQKKEQKKGLMQKLLTGEIRLNGFEREWKSVKVKDLVKKVVDNRGKTPPLSSEGIELIEVNALEANNKHPNYEKIIKYVNEETYNLWFRNGHPQKGDILVATVGSVGSAVIMNENRGCIAQNIIALRIKEEHNPDFVYYWMNSSEYFKLIKKVLMGAVQPSLKVPHLLNFDLFIPEMDEQNKIAEIFTVFDSSIELLANELETLKLQKKSLMQQLLTGKIRVKV